MATVLLYKDEKAWIEIPEWIGGKDRILLFIRQMALILNEDIGQEMRDVCRAVDLTVYGDRDGAD